MKKTIYHEKNQKTIVCNVCGQILQENGQQIAEKDWLAVKKSWGYFSGKDGKKHTFCICEECYDKWVADFLVPIEVSDETELLLL